MSAGEDRREERPRTADKVVDQAGSAQPLLPPEPIVWAGVMLHCVFDRMATAVCRTTKYRRRVTGRLVHLEGVLGAVDCCEVYRRRSH